MVKQRTQLMNCLRSQLAEFGIIAAPGGRGFAELSALVAAEDAASRRCCGRRCAPCSATSQGCKARSPPSRRRCGYRQDRPGDAAAGHHSRRRRARRPRHRHRHRRGPAVPHRARFRRRVRFDPARARQRRQAARQGYQPRRATSACASCWRSAPASIIMRYARSHGDRATPWQRAASSPAAR